MKKLFKLIFVLTLVGLVAAAVASYVSKKKLETMTDDEIREFLASKLQGKVGDEQLETIQNSVIAGVRKTTSAAQSAQDVIEDAIDKAADAAGDAVDAVSDAAADVKDAVEDAASDIADEIDDATGA